MRHRWQYDRMTTPSKVIAPLLLAVLGFSVGGCLFSSPPEAEPEPEPELPEVTLKPIDTGTTSATSNTASIATRHVQASLMSVHCAIASQSPSLAPIYVASELGYFSEEGLEVQVTEIKPPVENIAAPEQLLSTLGQNDIDCVAQPLAGYMQAQERLSTLETRVIANLYASTGADGLVVTNAIASLDDLLDQPVGGDRHHPAILMTYHALRDLGYSADDMVIRPIKSADWREDTATVGWVEDTKPNTDPDAENTDVEDTEATLIAQETELSDQDSDQNSEAPAPSPSFANLFAQEGVVAIAASEPRLSQLVEDTGATPLLTSAEFEGLLTDVLVVEREELADEGDRYQGLLRGIYQAIDLYESDRPQFLKIAAPYYQRSPQSLEQHLTGISYTSSAELQTVMGDVVTTGTLFQTFSDLNTIHLDLELQYNSLFYDDHIDVRLISDLFGP